MRYSGFRYGLFLASRTGLIWWKIWFHGCVAFGGIVFSVLLFILYVRVCVWLLCVEHLVAVVVVVVSSPLIVCYCFASQNTLLRRARERQRHILGWRARTL